MLPIKGIRALSLIDYPKHLSAVLFLGGCNFKCPFCHNYDLAVYPEKMENLDENSVFSELERRKKILEAVVITGGEPLLYPEVIAFIAQIKKMGYLVKVDTNGYTPELLEKVIETGSVDFISMDIKTALETEKYSKAAGIKVDIEKIKQSIQILLKNQVEYEFRTTWISKFVSFEDILQICSFILPAQAYYIQQANEGLEEFQGPEIREIEKKSLIIKEKFKDFNLFIR
ncbi:MAG TPA: anaerobic ribonucleoside-triphosphate reductase activating protein [Spirochaetia bacterium]|nr:MAG: anaerobic ribonucleoside-triphosphate reductase activating protein [Spirochaetes bacterium GWB1_36_13]HCL57087.1 anaerobic ribonucleoside-triphosphate reductase activating protein [Spirochaetia bacterium]